MKVLITGGAGFLGQRLARELLKRGEIGGASGERQRITELVLLDVAKGADLGDARVTSLVGDIGERSVLENAIDTNTAAIFHLAAIVSGQAEADFELAMRINLDASRSLLEVCRARGHRPRVVFTSSVAVYGGDLPALVQDETALNPQSSYGTQKAIAELLLSDYTRRGFVDGRKPSCPIAACTRAAASADTGPFSDIAREAVERQGLSGSFRQWSNLATNLATAMRCRS